MAGHRADAPAWQGGRWWESTARGERPRGLHPLLMLGPGGLGSLWDGEQRGGMTQALCHPCAEVW